MFKDKDIAVVISSGRLFQITKMSLYIGSKLTYLIFRTPIVHEMFHMLDLDIVD